MIQGIILTNSYRSKVEWFRALIHHRYLSILAKKLSPQPKQAIINKLKGVRHWLLYKNYVQGLHVEFLFFKFVMGFNKKVTTAGLGQNDLSR